MPWIRSYKGSRVDAKGHFRLSVWRGRIISFEIIIILALIVSHGVLAGAEVALASLRQAQLHEWVLRGRRGAQAVQTLRDKPAPFVAAAQLCITGLMVAAGALGVNWFTPPLAAFLTQLAWLAPVANGVATLLVILATTYACVLAGELVPAAIALSSPIDYALFFGRGLLGLTYAARPFTFFLTAGFRSVWRRLGGRATGPEATRETSEELQHLVDEATKSGSVHPRAAEIATRALTFGDLTVADVMVPRNRIKAVPMQSTPEEIRRILLEEGHSRMPVYDGTFDQIVGILVAKNVLALAWERELIVLEDLIQPAYFAPDIMRAVDLLKELQRRRMHFAVAVDELGGTAGIVTMEDLLEELVGEIFGEHDKDAPELIRPEPDGSALLQGIVQIRDANRELPCELPEGDAWSTVGGLCVSLAGRIPETGQKLALEDGTILEIMDASPRRVRLVRIRPATVPAHP